MLSRILVNYNLGYTVDSKLFFYLEILKNMKIKKLSVKYHPTGLEIQNVEFDDTLSLLVGISGVGKTSILSAINDLKNIVVYGVSINGFEWTVNFEVNNIDYIWGGRFEYVEENPFYKVNKMFNSNSKEPEYKIIDEVLFVNCDKIINRNNEFILFKNNKTVKLKPTASVLHLLQEEDEIFKIFDSFDKIHTIKNSDYSNNFWSLVDERFHLLTKKDMDINDIRSSLDTDNIIERTYLCQLKDADVFFDFVQTYKEIFPYVEDLKVESINLIGRYNDSGLGQLIIRIKEYDVDHWINHDAISTGMLKTLIHLAYIYFSQKGTVFLIDEFENGFGVNCINSISDRVLNSKDDYQYIITSHHPYIINNIPVKKWKIVNRSKNIITAESATKHIDASNHDAFIKLINSNFYTQGVEVNSNNNDLTEDDLYS